VSKKHLDGVMNYVELGRREGARLLCGGERLVTGPHARGAYMSPAIFDDCHDGMRVVKEEIFGPVAAILPFDTEEEVVRRANATEYGLSAGVFTKDIQRAHRVVRDIDAGTTWINNYNLAPAELPWTGHKLSGIGASNGTYGIEDWTQVKSVYVEMDKVSEAQSSHGSLVSLTSAWRQGLLPLRVSDSSGLSGPCCAPARAGGPARLLHLDAATFEWRD
jgi:betaine-aldehyde dehydrogenase